MGACGIVWTQNGGEICKTECGMGMIIKMTQNVCGMGCFLAKKSPCSATLFSIGSRDVWNGGFISNCFHIEMCGVAQKCVEWGVLLR